MRNEQDSFEYHEESKFVGGSFQRKPTLCTTCKELTFKTIDEGYAICQGCMTKTKHREKKRHRDNEDPDLVSDCQSPYFAENTEEVEEQFNSAMGRMHKLSPMEKQVIELLWEDKKQEEVAEILSITRDEVNTYLKRARIKLK